LVQQNPEAQFCTLMVEDELVFGLENRRLERSEIQERLEWSLGITNCSHLRERALATLSGGEKQKIAIAAMLAARPRVLIFDEPTSNLDPSATAEIFKVIQEIREKTSITVVVIEHKVNYLRIFEPRLIEMENGRIVNDQPLRDWQQPNYVNRETKYRRIIDKPIVSVKSIQAGYGNHPILENITLDIYAGEFVAVMGDNGSGKSTLMKTIANLIQPDEGSVSIADQNTRNIPVSELARSLGYIFQNPAHQLFANSVWNETVFAPMNFGILDERMIGKARLLLQEAGLQVREKDHPFRLSYGQMRRLNLVSVLVFSPAIYLIDELLIGQDVENGTYLLEQLNGMVAGGAAVVMVNHNPEAVRAFATRILFMEMGQILFDLPEDEGFRKMADLGKTAYLPGDMLESGRLA
ncbi:MAG TPA: ABC transporter ATP-binding protein, partial [Anaerolineales bacterium]|nr:ABC transporter ATP-binding protein [Anaerolineales bacterium]